MASAAPGHTPGATPAGALSGTARTELRDRLDRLTEVIDFLTDSLTGDEENDVKRDHSQVTEAVRAEDPDPVRVARFARRLRDTLTDLGTPSPATSPAIRMVEEILEVAALS
jgi:hypothetical protein